MNDFKCIYFKMLTTVRLANHSSPHIIFFVAGIMVRILMLHSHSKFLVFNIAFLTVLIILYIRFPEPTYFITRSLYTLTNIFPCSPPLSPWQPPFHSPILPEFKGTKSIHISQLPFFMLTMKYQKKKRI